MNKITIKIDSHILHNETEFQAKNIRKFLNKSKKKVIIFRNKIWVDDIEIRPNMGFAKTANGNYIIIRKVKNIIKVDL